VDLHHPFIESVILPFVVVLAATGTAVAVRSRFDASRLATTSVGIGFLLAVYLVADGLVWPPRTAVQKLPYVTAGLILAGTMLEGVARSRRFFLWAAAVVLTIMLLWLVWPQLPEASAGVFWRAGLVLLAGGTIMWTLVDREGKGRVPAPSMLVLAALGLAGAAFSAGSLVLFQIALGLAAAGGGFVLWNWPRPRLVFGPGGVLVAGIGLVLLALLLLTLTEIRSWALVPLLGVFVTDRLARRLPVPARIGPAAMEAVWIVILSLPLVAATVFLGTPAPAPDGLYYY
jgi:hypothetical protein